MLAIPPFVQHSSSLSLWPLPAFRTHFWIHSRLGLVFKVFLSLLFFFLSTCTYLTVMLHFLFIGLCYLAFRLLPSAGLCRRFSLRLPDSAAASALPLPAYLVIGSICSVPPPHAVTGTPPSEGMTLLTLRTLRKVTPTCYWITVSASAYHMQSSKFLPWTCFPSC